ncbi:MAG: sugar phosphate isomerase/epimerase family protein [Planctomycetota bacterium]
MRELASSRRSFLQRVVSATLAGTALPRFAAFAQDRAAPAKDPPRPGRSRWEIGVCAGADRGEELRAGGASYVEVGVAALVADKSDAEFTKQEALLKACALPIRAANSFLPGSLKSVGPDANHDGVLRFAETAFRRAHAVGIETIVFRIERLAHHSRGFERARAEEQMRALLGKMGPLAERHAITVAIEPLNKEETNFINTLIEGAAIVTAVGHPRIRLMADLYHVLKMDEPPDSIARTASLLCHVHIAEKQDRRPPGHGGEDFSAYFRELQRARDVRRVSIECRWDDVAKELPRAVATLQRQMDAAGAGEAR